ncbi:unnamed protein product [Cylindrotheca closterium]|uniref:Uncharacterized protein n=1 Tax=Cylindrotheca closterium TaxID=2856 RepID=A0AAD2CNK5_9STRA|nr:unnamed protein product [Cylindrotheca closterium]
MKQSLAKLLLLFVLCTRETVFALEGVVRLRGTSTPNTPPARLLVDDSNIFNVTATPSSIEDNSNNTDGTTAPSSLQDDSNSTDSNNTGTEEEEATTAPSSSIEPCLNWDDDSPCSPSQPTTTPSTRSFSDIPGLGFIVMASMIVGTIIFIKWLCNPENRVCGVWLVVMIVFFIVTFPWGLVLCLLCGSAAGGGGGGSGSGNIFESNDSNGIPWGYREPSRFASAPAPSPERWVVDSGITNHYGEPARWTRE